MSLNPFDEDAAPLTQNLAVWRDRLAAYDVGEIHADAEVELKEAFDRALKSVEDEEEKPESQLILLRAPRAGYGKTHLLARIASNAPRHSIFFPVEFRAGAASWPAVHQGFVHHLTEAEEGRVGISLSRRLMGELLARLVERGDVVSKHSKSAVPILRAEAERIFVKEADANLLIRWFVSNFSALRPLLVRELGRAADLTEARAEFWLDVMRGLDMPGADTRRAARLRALFLPENEATSIAARERVLEICAIARVLAPVAVIADDLDVLYGDTETAFRVASLVEEMRELAPGIILILSMNRDVWESAFGGSLPSALEDRFTAHAIDLEPLTRNQLEAVVRRRCAASGESEKEIDLLMQRAEAAITIADSPRSAIRHARHWWEPAAGPERVEAADEDEGEPDSFLLEPAFDDKSAEETEPVEEEPEMFVIPPEREEDETEPVQRSGKPWREVVEPERKTAPRPWSHDLSDINETADESSTASESGGGGSFVPFSMSSQDSFSADPLKNPPAVRRFRELQGELLASPEPIDMDAETLRQIIRLTGQASPLVEVSEVNLNGSTHPRTADSVTRWTFPENEIVFSFRSLSGDAEESWARLSQFMESRNGSAPSKVVVFTDGEMEDKPDYERLDVIDLDAKAKATLMAAGVVLAESSSSTEAFNEAFQQIAPELDTFWRRLTRPLAANM